MEDRIRFTYYLSIFLFVCGCKFVHFVSLTFCLRVDGMARDDLKYTSALRGHWLTVYGEGANMKRKVPNLSGLWGGGGNVLDGTREPIYNYLFFKDATPIRFAHQEDTQ